MNTATNPDADSAYTDADGEGCHFAYVRHQGTEYIDTVDGWCPTSRLYPEPVGYGRAAIAKVAAGAHLETLQATAEGGLLTGLQRDTEEVLAAATTEQLTRELERRAQAGLRFTTHRSSPSTWAVYEDDGTEAGRRVCDDITTEAAAEVIASAFNATYRA